MGFSEVYNKGRDFDAKINKAILPEKVIDAGQNVRQKVEKLARGVRNKVEGLGVDIDQVRDNTEFHRFLQDTHEPAIDWESGEDNARARESFRRFERANRITESYGKLFENRLKGLVESSADAKAEIRASILEMAEDNPDELRRLEKQLERVAKSEQLIQQKQEQIDLHKSKGGAEGLAEKVDTLKKARSWRRVAAQYTGAYRFLGLGEQFIDAHEKSKKEYGLETRQQMKVGIEESQKDLNEITSAEQAKIKIRSKYSKARAEVFLENDTAKDVHRQVNSEIRDQIDMFGDIDNLNKDQLDEAAKLVERLREQFVREGRRERTGKMARVLDSDPERNVPFGDVTPAQLDKYEKEINARITVIVERRAAEIIAEHSNDDLIAQVDLYVKKAQFAGKTPREASREVYQAFVKLKNKLNPNDRKRSALSLGLSRLRYVTA